ncbi:hypothetical protein KP509_25G074600 [Ceratopteris richardii]|uniref:Retrovirus-related Pol polyprotein from transposon TNT 1-94 n=1 Tax=Ceratopteris richardii TaxID=49495 RepID=A0A8T2RU30_CERRI|nr:hypothetical protein KP509_25G074600 [Ceratopteris richardii]
MDACNGIDTPLPIALKHITPETPEKTPSYPYANVRGCIRYLVSCTRPNICFATNFLSRHMHNPSPLHVMYLKGLLCYLKRTSGLSLTYKYNPSNFCLLGYSEADWGGDPSTCQSTSGYLFLLANGAVSWQSKKKTRVTLSSTEAKYSSMTLAIKEGIWLNTLLKESTLLIPPPISLYCDN